MSARDKLGKKTCIMIRNTERKLETSKQKINREMLMAPLRKQLQRLIGRGNCVKLV